MVHMGVDQHRRFSPVAVLDEAGPSWYWLYELLEECAGEIKLANPAGVREGREVHRFRIFLVRLSTALKNRVHAALKRRAGAGTATIAVARKLARATYCILHRREPYCYNALSTRHLGKPRVILSRP